ncbi:MAG: hypothetical protein J5I93_14830, partial [Pirellulaceae bacterium]|nr:hypothetical protein [Pirellulaceae bacterium]
SAGAATSAGAPADAGAAAFAGAPADSGAAVSEAEPPRAGYEHDPSKLATAYYLGAATAGVALLGIVPAIFEIADHFQHLDDSPGIARWTWLLLVLGCVQLAYALYVVQLPDWSSVWVVALACLGLAAAYAMVLGAVLLSTADNGFIQFMHLHLVPRRQTSRWCFMMLSLTSLLTYFAGRAAVRWHHTYRLMTGL